ncbi:MAG: bifunctional nuclease family protein [Vulcanimicrobiota bacterium]
MRKMRVDKLGIDLLSHDPVVILKDVEGKRFLPILIGPFEATAIALALEGTHVPRPLSHDLMKSMIEALNAKVLRVVIHDIHENTFYAKIVIESNGKNLEIDARPSDSIALALRTSAPIFVSERIILEETVVDPKAEHDVNKFKSYIDNLKPADFLKGTVETIEDEEIPESPDFFKNMPTLEDMEELDEEIDEVIEEEDNED